MKVRNEDELHKALCSFLVIVVVSLYFILGSLTFKCGISIVHIADFSKPHENISYPQQLSMKRFHLKCIYLFL
jgi:hypothetical protein